MAGKAPILLAIAYDFDGTLAPGNMQEHSFLPEIGIPKEKFWDQVRKQEVEHDADNILVYMRHMLRTADQANRPVRREDFHRRGRNLKFYEGVRDWFRRINTYGRKIGITVEHYIISSGIREIVMGSPIAEEFKAVFASTFLYDANGVATWPALALNYTTKTQYLFRINKGSLKVSNHSTINRFIPKSKRPIPFPNMIYIGDGETDVPCFRLVKDQGGYSIVVYKPHAAPARKKAMQLFQEGRVNFVVPADYRAGQALDRIVKAIMEKLQRDYYLRSLEPKGGA